jgi:hypothetical protein
MDSVFGLVRFSNARTPLPVSRKPGSSNAFGCTKCFFTLYRWTESVT